MKSLIHHMVLVLALGTLLTGASMAFACEGKRQPNFERLAEKLGLQENQVDSFVAIMEEHHQKRRQIKQAQTDNKRELMSQHRQALLTALGAVLDEQQLADFEQHLQDRRRPDRRHKTAH